MSQLLFIMQKVKIYADFNGVIGCSKDLTKVCIVLTGYGTLASLSRYKIRLREGMRLTFYEPDDIEVEGEIFFDTNIPSDFSPFGQWVAQFDAEQVRESKESYASELKEHLCFNCSFDLKEYLRTVGQQFKEICPHCGTDIMYPLLPPENNSNYEGNLLK